MPRRAAQKLSSMWRSASLRTQLVTITTALLLLTLFVTTFVSASLFRQELLRNMDEDLAANADLVSSYLHQAVDPDEPEVEHGSIVRFHAWVVDQEGNPVVRTHWPSEARDHPELPRPTFEEAQAQFGESFEVPGSQEDSRGWRVQIHPLSSGEGSLVIALPLRSVETSVERATFLVATIGLLATLGASIIAYSLVTRAFRPLLKVERTAGAIAGGDFSQRVQTTAPRETEVGRLAASLNVMLEHIEKAFDARVASEEKMRRFIQDASHELRTPLVTIRGFSELYRQGGMEGNPDAVHAAMGRIESEATRLGDLVEDLLTLARLDEQRPMEPVPLDLNIVAHEAMMDMSVNAPDRTVRVIGLDDGPARPAPVIGDEGRIRQVVTNLVQNALRYTPEGTPIELAVGTESLIEGKPESLIQVRDHGEGISEEDAEKIFQRFYRSDSSRHRETGGTGLGLAICAAIAAQHDGSVRHSETEGGGATMTLRLPMAEPPEEDAVDDDEGLDEDPSFDTGDIEHLREAALQHRSE